MAKRSSHDRDRERVSVEDEPTPSTTRLRLLKEMTLNIKGPVTGTLYRFFGAGYELDVDERDAEIMITKRPGSACCPGSGIGQSTPYFRIVR